MLNKPLTHLRPLLRLPSHAPPQPTLDHFTSNPSLLHHLPQGGASHTLVTQSSVPNAAGNGAGAGRAGWNGSSGSGGYTGHARAFLSLPQTTSVDPGSSLGHGTDDSDTRKASWRKHRLEKDRLVRLVEVPEAGPSEIRKAIHSHRGSRLAVVDLESPARTSQIEGGRRSRRNSIAFPTPSPSTPRISRSSTPRRPEALSRSNSEVFQVGITHTLRSRPSSRDLTGSRSPTPLISTPTISTTSKIPQPNRVLMDLAGLDIPKRSGISARYNSSAAALASSDINNTAFDDSLVASQGHSSPAANQDYKIFNALVGAKEWKQRDLVYQLVTHYRSPRVAEPFDREGIVGVKALAKRLPLPPGWTVATYNACLDAVLSVRNPGESIALVLEIYNEMLERELIPNSRTYAFVIRALCHREQDVGAATKRWEEDRLWGRWRAEKLKAKWRPETEAEKDGLVDGYKAEGNLSSAMKLFRAAIVLQQPGWAFHSATYAHLLDTISSHYNPDISALQDVFQHAKDRKVKGWKGFYRYLIRGYGSAGDKEGVETAFAEFEALRQEEPQDHLRDWIDHGVETDEGLEPMRIVGAIRTIWDATIQALIKTGEIDRAMGMVDDMMATQRESEGQVQTSGTPPVNGYTYSAVLTALLQAGQIDKASQWYHRLAHSPEMNRTRLQRFELADIHQFVDQLVLAGRSSEAAEVYGPKQWRKAGRTAFNPDRDRIKKIYMGLIVDASAIDASPEQIVHSLNTVKDLIMASEGLQLDVPTWRLHLRLLVDHGKQDQFGDLLDAFAPPVAHIGFAQDLVESTNAAVEKLGLLDANEFLRAMQRHRQFVSPEAALSLIKKYENARSTVPTPEEIELPKDGWLRLVNCFGLVYRHQWGEGEMDGLFETFMADLSSMRHGKGDQLPVLDTANADHIRRLGDILGERFGRDRSAEMLTVFGPAAKEYLDSLPKTAEIESSPSLSADESSMIDSAGPRTPASSEGGSLSSRAGFDSRLSYMIDTCHGRNPNITPSYAYDLVKRNMKQNNHPHLGSISRLINALSRGGNSEEKKVNELYKWAQQILSAYPAGNDTSADWRLVEDAMIVASCHFGHLEQAGLHRGRIVQAGMAPSADAYATMIASSKDTTDDALVARELFDESQSLGVKPHLFLYNTIISKLSRARKAELALELFAHMKSAELRPSSVTYGAVINACCRVGDVESAETLFAEMSSQPNFKPRVPPYNTMMQFYLQTVPSREKVLHYFSLLRSTGVPPSAHTYKLLLDAYSALPPLDLAAVERVFSELVYDKNVPLQGTHWASVISAYGVYSKDVTRALEIFDAIPSHPSSKGTEIEPVTWESILNVVGTHGTHEQLDTLRERLVESGQRPTAYIYNVLISGYARHNKIETSRDIFESMGDSITGVAAPNNHPTLRTSAGHLKPATMTEGPTDVVYREPSTYESMIRAEMAIGEVGRAENILKRMEGRMYPVAVYMRARSLLDLPITQRSEMVGSEVPRHSFVGKGVEEVKDLGYTRDEAQLGGDNGEIAQSSVQQDDGVHPSGEEQSRQKELGTEGGNGEVIKEQS